MIAWFLSACTLSRQHDALSADDAEEEAIHYCREPAREARDDYLRVLYTHFLGHDS